MGRQMLLNAMGLAIGSAYDPALEREFAMVQAMRTPPQATVLARDVKVAVTWAAFLNATSVHMEDYDDHHYKSRVKSSGPIPAAVLAFAEYTGASPQQMIDAIVIASEVAIRLGMGLGDPHLDYRWHPTATVGQIGVAIAVGRLAGLTEGEMLNAVGIAGTLAGGTIASRGKMAKPLQVGKTSMQGIESVFLTEAGFKGAPTIVEGPRGLASAMAGSFNEGRCMEGIGKHWEMTENSIKPFACGVVADPIIDAAIKLREHFASLEDLDRMEILTNPFVPVAMGIADPRDGLESKFSAIHGAAVGFVELLGGPAQFSDRAAQDPQVVAVRRKTVMETTPDIPEGGAVVTAYRVDGQKFTVEENSRVVMTQEALERKVRGLAGDRVETLFRVFERYEKLARVDELLEAVPNGPSPLMHHA
jgi:2-methylcitrate dehydratase PrpD